MSNSSFSSEASSPVAGLSHEALQRLAGQSARCKLWAALAATAALMLAFETGHPALLWGALPLLLLALADAGYAAQAGRIAEFGRRAAQGKDPGKAGEFLQMQAAAWRFQGALGGLKGLLSFTVWPFYLALAGAVVGLASSGMITAGAPPAPSLPVRTPTGFAQQGSPYAARPGINPANPQTARPFPNTTKNLPFRPALPGNGTTPHLPLPQQSGPHLSSGPGALPSGTPVVTPVPAPQPVPVPGLGVPPPTLQPSPAPAPAATPPPVAPAAPQDTGKPK